MRHFLHAPAVFFTVFLMVSCNEKPDKDLTTSVNKNGSVESAVTTTHLNDSLDVLITSHTVWKNNMPVKKTEYRDTIPSLGMETKEVPDKNGNEVKAEVKKDYEIYITVK